MEDINNVDVSEDIVVQDEPDTNPVPLGLEDSELADWLKAEGYLVPESQYGK
jgi:hypothetical protein